MKSSETFIIDTGAPLQTRIGVTGSDPCFTVHALEPWSTLAAEVIDQIMTGSSI